MARITIKNQTAPVTPSSGLTEVYVDSSTKRLATKDDTGAVTDYDAGGGDVDGPASSTDNAIVRFDGTTGKLLQNTANATVADSGEITSASLTASRVLVAGTSKEVQSSSITTTTLGYLDATSSIQTQLDAKQALDATLTALAAYNTNGLITQTAADTFVGRTITGTSNRLTVTNGDGVSGNPTLDISASYVGQASITTLGTVATGVWNATTIAAAKLTVMVGDSGAGGVQGAVPAPAAGDAAAGYFLKADGTWALPAGGGGGTPGGSDTQVQFNDGGSFGGDAGFTYDKTTDTATIDTLVLGNPLAIADGGTNSGTTLNNNRLMVSATGAIVEAAAITAARALISDANGIPTHATTTATEIGYVNGVTSAIQTQLNAKQATITGAATTIVSSDLTVDRALISDGSGKVAVATTTATEIGYVSGVTSALQTQLNNKQGLDATLTALAAYNTNGILTQTAADTFTGRTITGTSNRLTVTNGDGVSGNPTLDISSSYVGQASITTLGTITTGVWTGTDVAVADGGTGASTAAGAVTNLGLDNTKIASIGITIDGGGSVITTGWKGTVTVPYACTITGWQILSSDAAAPVSGAIVIDVQGSSYASYPTMASIAGTEKPTLSTAQKNQDLSLSTWTTSVAAGSVIGFNVDSVTAITRVNLVLFVTKT